MTNFQARAVFYKAAVISLLAGILGSLLFINFYFFAGNDASQFRQQNALPFNKDILRIMKPLSYDGLHIFLDKDVSLTIDPAEKTFTLHNVHRFTPDGTIMLKDGRRGLCGELSAYVYQKLKPIVKDAYSINFVRVLESGYFLSPQASHVILLLTKESGPGEKGGKYLLDPAFHRYGAVEDFDNYLFLELIDSRAFEKENFTDFTGVAGSGPPLLIKDNTIIALFIDKVDGEFDRDNFSISVLTKYKNKFAVHNLLFMLRKQDGKIQKIENRLSGEYLLTQKGYRDLTQKIIDWAGSI